MDGKRLPDGRDQAAQDPDHLPRGFDVLDENGEFVAAQAGHGVHLAEFVGEALAHLDQEPVPGQVSQAVVDVLEAVEVEQQDGEQVPVVALGAADGPVDAFGDQRPVGQPGQGVVERLVGELFLVRLLGGDVLECAQNADDLAVLIAQRNFVGVDVALDPVGHGHAFDEVQVGLVLLHDLPVYSAVEFRLFGFPGQVFVRFAGDLLRGLEASGLGKVPVAAEVHGLGVLPVDVLGDVLHDHLEHLAGGAQVVFGHLAARDLRFQVLLLFRQFGHPLLQLRVDAPDHAVELEPFEHGRGVAEDDAEHGEEAVADILLLLPQASHEHAAHPGGREQGVEDAGKLIVRQGGEHGLGAVDAFGHVQRVGEVLEVRVQPFPVLYPHGIGQFEVQAVLGKDVEGGGVEVQELPDA